MCLWILLYSWILSCYFLLYSPQKKKYAQGLGPENMDIIVFWGAKENRSSCWFFFPKFWYAKDLTVVRGPSSINQENWIRVFSAILFRGFITKYSYNTEFNPELDRSWKKLLTDLKNFEKTAVKKLSELLASVCIIYTL